MPQPRRYIPEALAAAGGAGVDPTRGRWQEREQDHDLSPQTQFPFASRLCGRLQPSILARRLNPEPTSAKLDQRAAYVALPSEAGLAGSRALVICGGNNQK